MMATDTTVFCFLVQLQILPLYGGYLQRSPVWILREGETAVPGRSCTSTTTSGDNHTRLRHFLGGIASRRSKRSKKSKELLRPTTSATSTLSIKQWNARTTKLRGTEVSSHNSRDECPRKERQWNFARIFFFLSTMADINFRPKVSARGL